MVSRVSLALVFLLFLQRCAVATEQNFVAQTTAGPVNVRIYSASGDKPRPAVLILHGASGLTPGDEQYASDLARAGMDAWLFSYYSAADEEVMHGTDRARRVEFFNERFRDWAKMISDIAGFALKQKGNSGHVGLLGLSNGGFLLWVLEPSISASVHLSFFMGVSRAPSEAKSPDYHHYWNFTAMPTALSRSRKAAL